MSMLVFPFVPLQIKIHRVKILAPTQTKEWRHLCSGLVSETNSVLQQSLETKVPRYEQTCHLRGKVPTSCCNTKCGYWLVYTLLRLKIVPLREYVYRHFKARKMITSANCFKWQDSRHYRKKPSLPCKEHTEWASQCNYHEINLYDYEHLVTHFFFMFHCTYVWRTHNYCTFNYYSILPIIGAKKSIVWVMGSNNKSSCLSYNLIDILRYCK